jgi:hypothetical protein
MVRAPSVVEISISRDTPDHRLLQPTVTQLVAPRTASVGLRTGLQPKPAAGDRPNVQGAKDATG